jgi:hypothetical protein
MESKILLPPASTRYVHERVHAGKWDNFAPDCAYCACPLNEGFYAGFNSGGHSSGICVIGTRAEKHDHGRQCVVWRNGISLTDRSGSQLLWESWLRPLTSTEITAIKYRWPGANCYSSQNFPYDHVANLRVTANV